MKHDRGICSRQNGRFRARCPALEEQVATLSDEIAYYRLDLVDGLEAGLLSEKQLDGEVPVWRQARRRVEREYGRLADECRRYFIIRCLIDMQVTDVVQHTEALIARRVRCADDVRRQARPLVQYSPGRRQQNLALRRFLYRNLYYNPVVNEPHLRARRVLEELFAFYLEHPAELGGAARRRARRDGWERAVCDYLAGMTDRYALLEHQRLLPPA
jgi:dGTPase